MEKLEWFLRPSNIKKDTAKILSPYFGNSKTYLSTIVFITLMEQNI